MHDTLNPLTALGGPKASGTIRSQPEDFVVSEELGFSAAGEGQHVLLRIRKRGIDTTRAVTLIARHLGVKPRDIGHAGLKDRHAVTEQWLSIDMAHAREDSVVELDTPELVILEHHKHDKKLRPGAHRANRFQIRVRDLCGDLDALEASLHRIAESGVPNFFGSQRFGNNAANIERARRYFEVSTSRETDKRQARRDRSAAFSTARALLFNRVLDSRVADGTWNRLLPGDMANLDGRGSVFHVADVDDELIARAQAGEIHPTGPLWGEGDPETTGVVLEAERKACAIDPLGVALSAHRAKQARRPLRVMAQDLQWHVDAATLVVTFSLAPGAYATTILREALSVEDARGGHEKTPDRAGKDSER